MEKFPKEVVWVETANPSDLVHGMKEVLKMTESEKEEFGQKAKSRVLSLYSLQSISNNVQPFLEQFVR